MVVARRIKAMRLFFVSICLAVLVGCAGPLPKPGSINWQSPVGLDHPLVNRVFETSSGSELTPGGLIEKAARSNVVWLGERHDNPDHHVIQAWIVDQLGQHRSFVSSGPPRVVFEMITMDQNRDLQDYMLRNRWDMSDLGRTLKWEKRGWPNWNMYAPIAVAAARNKMTITPGAASDNTLKRVRAEGLTALSPAMLKATGLKWPLPPKEQQALEQDLIDSHCGMIRSDRARKFSVIQRLRDGMLAARATQDAQNAVVIAGAEHVRLDRGGPAYLKQAAPNHTSLSIAMIEVNPAQTNFDMYDSLPYDVVWFTPALPDVDFCAQMKARINAVRKTGPE